MDPSYRPFFKRAFAGERHSFLLDEDGIGMRVSSSLLISRPSGFPYYSVYAFGWGGYLQLGLGDREDCLIPTPLSLPSPSPVINVSASAWHSLFLLGYSHSSFP